MYTDPGIEGTEKRRNERRIRRHVRTIFLSSFFLVFFLAFFLTAFPLAAQTGEGYAGPSDAFRKKAMEETAKDNRKNFHFVAAKLRTGRDTALAWRQLDSLLAEPTGDMFWTYPATAFYFYCNDLLSDGWKKKFRTAWKTYTNYRGDTENHFLMYYGTLYLMAQEWPDLPGSEWFNGKSSAENFREAEEYLHHWIDETVRYGQTEWDSPRYFYFYMLPLLTLYDFADDPRMKTRCGMMAEYLLADYAADYLKGNYCGAHSRDGDGSVINPRNAEARAYSDFYWEDSLGVVLPDLAFAAMSTFRCPEIIRAIAHDRDTAFVHYEQKRSRGKMRYSHERYTPVYKTTYMTPDYALGSIRGGLQQPIQQHTWDVTFASAKPNNTLFSLHPYASATELGMFFPEEPELMEKAILNSKASYGSEDKWIGGSPYESVEQNGGMLRAVYTLPQDGTRFGHVDLYFPKTLDMLIKNSGGRTLAFMGEVMVDIGITGADSSAWIDEKENRRLRLFGKTITVEAITGMRGDMDPRNPAATTERLRSEYGRAYPSQSYPDLLFRGPHLNGERNTGVLTMTCSGMRRVLDFTKDEIRER